MIKAKSRPPNTRPDLHHDIAQRNRAREEICAAGGYLDDKGCCHISLAKNNYREALSVVGHNPGNIIELKLDDIPVENFSFLRQLKILRTLKIRHGEFSDDDISHISALAHLENLSLASERISDDVLKYLCNLHNLKWLDLHAQGTTGRGFEHLAKLKNMRRLDIDGARLTESGAKALGRLSNLDWLSLRRVGGDANTVLNAVAAMIALRILCLGDLDISEAGWAQIEKLSLLTDLFTNCYRILSMLRIMRPPGLKNLSLWGKEIEQRHWVDPGKLDWIEELDVQETSLTDLGLVEIGRLQKLEYLDLQDTEITDVGLRSLDNLTRLREVRLERTKVTKAGVLRLKGALPKCQVVDLDDPWYYGWVAPT